MQRIILSIIIATIPSIGADVLGARAQGMGGAQVALVDDVTAVFWNPAAFGLQDNIFSTDTIFGFTAFDNLTEYINQLDEYYRLKDELPKYYQDFVDYLADNSGEAHRYLDNIITSLNAFNDPGVGVMWNLHSGAAMRIGPVVFSWLNENRLEVGPWVDTHLSRLIPSEYLQSPQNVLALYIEGLLTEEEFNLLWPGYDPNNPDVSTFIGDIQGNEISLEENHSIITLNGVELNNLALSYGYSFEMKRGDYISVGASLRFIYGERYGDSISILNDIDIANFDPDIFNVGSNWLLNSLFSLRSIATGSGFSVDLGVQGKLGEYFRYGVLARNIIPAEINWDDPRFKPTPIRPELRLGVAFEPWEGINLALDLDILAVDKRSSVYNPQSGVEEDAIPYRERILALGAEWDIGGILALRAGLNTNYNAIFEEASPAKLFVSVGVGFNIGDVFHLSLAVMSNLITPKEVDAGLGASFGLGFSL